MNHPQSIGRAELLDSGLFDAKWYADHYQDVAISGLDPLQHFLAVGILLQRCPGPNFNPQHYLEAYPDVAASGMSPLVHYIRYGQSEGRDQLGPQALPAPHA